MSKPIRPRGRPPGTGLKDEPTLHRMADLMVANPHLWTTAAIRLAVSQPSDAVIRRLQDKWKKGAEGFLKDAQRRKADREAAPRNTRGGFAGGRTATESVAKWLYGVESSAFDKAAREIDNSAMARAMREIDNSAVARATREIDGSAVGRAMKAIDSSALSRAMREVDNSATARAMREFENSPTMKAMREIERLRRWGVI